MHFRKASYKTLALVWSLLLLFNTSGLTMDMHFCQGKLKRVNLFGKAKTCVEIAACMKKCGKSKAATCGSKGDHKGCCNNESVDLDQNIDLLVGLDKEELQIDLYVDSDLSLYFLLDDIPINKQGYFYFDPPPLIQKLHIIHQRFLL